MIEDDEMSSTNTSNKTNNNDGCMSAINMLFAVIFGFATFAALFDGAILSMLASAAAFCLCYQSLRLKIEAYIKQPIKRWAKVVACWILMIIASAGLPKRDEVVNVPQKHATKHTAISASSDAEVATKIASSASKEKPTLVIFDDAHPSGITEEELKNEPPQDTKFMEWALENTAITDIEIKGPSIYVTLKDEKYTTPENVSKIASFISRAYVNQTGARYANTHVYLGNNEYASGSSDD